MRKCECGCRRRLPKSARPTARFLRGHRIPKVTPPIDRAMAKVDARGDNECWPWTGYAHNGAGFIIINQVDVQVARIVYDAKVAPVRKGDIVRHTCGNKLCCNPAHLTTAPTLCEHGTVGRYSAGCRCAACRKASSDLRRNMKEAHWQRRVTVDGRPVAAHLPDGKHGLASTYSHYGCRCAPCTATNSAKAREYHQRRACHL